MNAWWQRLCGCGKVRTITSLADALDESTESKAMFFRGTGDDDLETLFVELCKELNISSYVVHVGQADGALLNYYCVNHVPMCVFIVKNKWTYIMPAPSAATIASAKQWLYTSCA
jgi:hypothetical protein